MTAPAPTHTPPLVKAATGISGLDELTGGGLPAGRPTLVCGPAGCGKTLLATEFLVRGITQFDEPGVFIAFEESVEDLATNVVSLGFDLASLQAEGLLAMDHVAVSSTENTLSGDWDLDGLFVRLGAAIDAVGAKRVVIDTIETLFGAFSDIGTLRSELQRLFAWLKQRGVTVVITGERGDGGLTRHGIEEYVSDCVLVLDHRVSDEVSTRRLRILKYRGSLHGTNEYPFVIGAQGLVVMPITSLGLDHTASPHRVSTGIDALDDMLGGAGFFKGSSVLVSGAAGTGKSTIAARFCEAACERGEQALYIAFEESESQIVRNMASVGADLARWAENGRLRFHCLRPSQLGLEAHLVEIQQFIASSDPDVVVIDPISDLLRTESQLAVWAMLTRQLDYLKTRGVTSLFTSLQASTDAAEAGSQIGSLIDTWVALTAVQHGGERRRVIHVVKSRGMAHSDQVRHLRLTDSGVHIGDVNNDTPTGGRATTGAALTTIGGAMGDTE